MNYISLSFVMKMGQSITQETLEDFKDLNGNTVLMIFAISVTTGLIYTVINYVN